MKNNSLNVKFFMFGFMVILQMIYLSGCKKVNTNDSHLDSILNTPFSVRSAMSLAIRKSDIASLYGKPDITRMQMDYSYEIRILSDGSRFFVFYNNSGIVTDSWRFDKLFDRNAFKNIVVQKSVVEDVKKIDPYFQIFEYSENKDSAISEHRLLDGSLLVIIYKKIANNWIVDTITYMEQDPSGFVSKILPEDR